MKNKILALCIPLLYACGNSENQNESNLVSSPVDDKEKTTAIAEPKPADTYILSLLSLNARWLRSWDFEPQVWSIEDWVQDSLPLTNQWVRIQRDPETSYMEDLWIYNENSGLSLDLYSHHTSQLANCQQIQLDENQKIQLFSRDKNEYLDLLTFGKSTGIEQARWVGSSSMILYGYVQEENGLFHPVIMEVVLELGYYKIYELNHAIEQNRRDVLAQFINRRLNAEC